jgi:sRNA-binding carbon storage regulator CsrA
MALTLTRRVGESFTLTWPTGEQRLITVEDIGVKNVYLSIEGGGYAGICHGAPLTTGVPGDKALAEIGITIGCELGSGQVKLYVDAPLTVKVLRDNAKCREAKS